VLGALFGYHWDDHAGQLAKIRKAAGLPDATSRRGPAMPRTIQQRMSARGNLHGSI